MRRTTIHTWCFGALLLCFTLPVKADHPIEVQRLTADGKYFEALTLFERLPKRQVTPAVTEAAARSFWALGLAEQASQYFDQLARSESLTDAKRARIIFMRAMLELQEDRPRVAILFAERAAQLLPKPTKLRGSIFMLWGDAYARLEQFGAAKKKYERASEEVAHELTADVSFRIAQCAKALGETELALKTFRKVPISHIRAPEALRSLAELSLQVEDYEAVQFWLTKAKEMYPDEFLDSWVEYALARAAIEEKDFGTMRKIREQAVQKYPPSDSWVALLEAIAEKAEWNSDKIE